MSSGKAKNVKKGSNPAQGNEPQLYDKQMDTHIFGSSSVDAIFRDGYISQKGLANLAHYKYSGSDLSFLYNLVLTHYFDWLVLRMPLWIAPNMLTLIGVMFNYVFYFLLGYYTPHLTGVAPAWVYFVSAFCIFAYQSLDNIDGRQARRTGSSSPLGELFDHVCDAASCPLFALSLTATLQLGPWYGYATLLAICLPFYFAHWEEYYSGSLVLGKWNGPTEAQVLSMAVYVGTGIARCYGFDFWSINLFGEISIGKALAISFYIGAVLTCATHIGKVVGMLKHRPGAIIKALLQLTPITVVVGLGSLWIGLSWELFVAHPRTIMMSCAMAFVYLVTRLIVQRICSEPIRIFYVIEAPFFVLSFNAVWTRWFMMTPLVEEEVLMWLFLVYSVSNVVFLGYSLIRQLCAHLKINAFTIPYPSSSAASKKRLPAKRD